MHYYLRSAAQDIVGVPISTAVGSEGFICKIAGRSDQSLKIFNDPIPIDLEARLKHEIQFPPVTIADRVGWPQDIVEEGRGDTIGYLQQHFGQPYVPFTVIASSMTRPAWASEKVLLQCAYDAAFLVAELNSQGYLYPDIHSEQFLVAQNLPTVLIDMASCQFTSNGTLYPCTHAVNEYQPPGLLGSQNWAQVADKRDVYTDSWSLAVLLFELTMDCHPFDGVYRGTGTNLSPAERAKQGQFPFDHSCRDYRPPPNALAYRFVDPDLRDLFFRCFVEGHRHEDRAQRPTSAEWADVLRHCPQLHSQPPQGVATSSRSQSGATHPGDAKKRLAQAFQGACGILALVAIVGTVIWCLIAIRPSRSEHYRETPRFDASGETLDSRQPSTSPSGDRDIESILDILRHKVPPTKKETRP